MKSPALARTDSQ